MAGPIVATIVGGVEGAVVVGGLSVLGAAIKASGSTEQQAIKYESALKVEKYVLLVHGSSEDLAKASAILATSHAQVSA